MITDRPKTPTDDDCCGNACNPCVFDVHKKLLKQWKEQKLNGNNNYSYCKVDNNLLSPTYYQLFQVNNIETINNHYITIEVIFTGDNDKYNNHQIILNPSQHVVLNISSFSKPLTPISWSDIQLKLLIRTYKNSKFTHKLKSLTVGEELKIRGPFGDFFYKQNSFKKIFMFGIGSGLAALYPICKSITDDDDDETLINLIIGFHCLEQVPMKRELQLLTDYWNVNCTLQISEKDVINHLTGIHINYEKINENNFQLHLKDENPESTLILICGNNEFNKLLQVWVSKYKFINYHIFQ